MKEVHWISKFRLLVEIRIFFHASLESPLSLSGDLWLIGAGLGCPSWRLLADVVDFV